MWRSNMGSELEALFNQYVIPNDHDKSDYFGLIKELVAKRQLEPENSEIVSAIEAAYRILQDEIETRISDPGSRIKFGTSGWRGKLGKDVFLRTVACVTQAIVDMYENADAGMLRILGVHSIADAKAKGCVVGFDNRFGGRLFGELVTKILSDNGFKVYYSGEATTGALSASVLVRKAAFSVNLTPSHNPLEYGGYKYNAADGGPAAAELTGCITDNACKRIDEGYQYSPDTKTVAGEIELIRALDDWKQLVKQNEKVHGLDLDAIIEGFSGNEDCVAVIDSVHGASRLDVRDIFNGYDGERLINLRGRADVTFGGIAPEPSSPNMKGVMDTLGEQGGRLKIGAIIDPDGDRIRFTDGEVEISMNQFGAMAYHFLATCKKKKGMVAKTVATSNLANRLADSFGEELFEPPVGFKEFKPVIGKALVLFEESDGISIIGHTPEKDAYIGLLLALDMVLTTKKNLGDYLRDIEGEFGAFYPDRDGLVVSLMGEALLDKLAMLEKFEVGSSVEVGDAKKEIAEVITIDGRKMIFGDGSWIMIRPSGTEPKVRFYVESRDPKGTADLVAAATQMLQDIGVV